MLLAHIMGVPFEELLAPSTTVLAACALGILGSRVASILSRHDGHGRR